MLFVEWVTALKRDGIAAKASSIELASHAVQATRNPTESLARNVWPAQSGACPEALGRTGGRSSTLAPATPPLTYAHNVPNDRRLAEHPENAYAKGVEKALLGRTSVASPPTEASRISSDLPNHSNSF